MVGKVKFPMYDQLLEISKNEDSNSIDLRKMSTTINSLPIEKLEIIQALILHHYFLNSRGENIKIPYGGTLFYGKGIRYTIKMFPDQLKLIINNFLEF